MKRIISVCLICLLLLSLPACGSNAETDEQIITSEQSAITETTTASSTVTEETITEDTTTEQTTVEETTVTTESTTTTEEKKTETKYKGNYQIEDDGTVTIHSYTGKDKDIVIPETIEGYPVTTIAGFQRDGMTSITLPDTVTTIAQNAFNECQNLETVVLSKNLTTIGMQAFKDCESLKNMTLPDSLESVGYGAFENTPWYSIHKEGYVVSDGCCFIEYTGTEENITIPDGITVIADNAFQKNRNIVTVTLPETIKYIGNNCFNNCENLSYINLPDSITYIGDSAFALSLCEGDDITLNMPNSIEYIGEMAFAGTHSVIAFDAPDDLEIDYVGRDAFSSNGWFKSCGEFAIMGNTLIGGHCRNTISIPDGVTVIADYAFYDDTDITEVILPDTVTKIGMCAFTSCNTIENITLSANLTQIGAQAFAACGITTIDIPDTVTEIGYDAFRTCEHLKSIKLPDNITEIPDTEDSYGGMFVDCESLQEVILPANLEKIGKMAFKNCTQLADIEIPDTVTSIGDQAFNGCDNLSKVTVPDTICYIGDLAFNDNVIISFKDDYYIFGTEYDKLAAKVLINKHKADELARKNET